MRVLLRHACKYTERMIFYHNRIILWNRLLFGRAQQTSTGLYVSLTTFLGFGQEYVEGYYRKTGNAVFLHIFREKIELPPAEPANDGPEKKITRLAIGVEGGFDPNENKKKYEYKDHLNVVVFPNTAKIAYPNIDLPLQVSILTISPCISNELTCRLRKQFFYHITWTYLFIQE